MSDQKYSIDDILREAAKIRAGGSFLQEPVTEKRFCAPMPVTTASPPVPQHKKEPLLSPQETPETSDFGAADSTGGTADRPAMWRIKATATRRPQSARTVRSVASQTEIRPGSAQISGEYTSQKSVSSPSVNNTSLSQGNDAQMMQDVLSNGRTQQQQERTPSPNNKGDKRTLSTVHAPQSVPAQRKGVVPIYIPAEQAEYAPPPKPAFPTEKEILAEIYEKKSQYTERRNVVEPRPDYNPQYTVPPRFNTADANAKEVTRVIDAEALKKIVPTPPRDSEIAFSGQNSAKTQVIDPRELGRKPDFRFIREIGTMHTVPNARTQVAPQENRVPPIAVKRDYANDFQQSQPQRWQQASADAGPSVSTVSQPSKNRFIKGSVIRKSERTDEILFTKNPPPVIERPAVMKGKTKFQKTGDLQSIPEIISIESPGAIPVSPPAMPKMEEFDYSDRQLKLDGFENEAARPGIIDEGFAEEQLFERRKEKVNHFKLFGSGKKETDGDYDDYYEFGEEDESDLEPIDDYNSPQDKESILESLAAKEQKLGIRTIATGAFTVLMLFFSVLEVMDVLPSLFSDAYASLTLSAVMTGFVLLFNINTLRNGLWGLFRLKLDADFPATVAALFVVAQTVYAYLTPDLITEGLPLYTMALSFGLLCNDIGKQALLRRVRANFEFLTSGGDKYTVQNISDPQDTHAICYGLLMGDPVVKHSVKTTFPTNFLEIAYKQEPADGLSKKLAPFTLLISIAIGVGTYFLNKNISLAISAAACAACVSVPVVSLLASNTALLSISKKIKSNGAMVNGFHGAEQAEDTNAIIFDAADLFPGGSCDLHGIKTFGGMRVDDAILQTAAVVISSRGPLQDVFDKVIVGKQSILPEVESIVYEDRMGTSGWIYGKKILVGNRQLLINHGVKVPPEAFEAKYKREERYLLYLTVAGKIAAMFVVSYKANAKVKEELHRLEKSGMTVLVRTADPNISEEMLTRQYELAEGFVRVLSSASGRVYEKHSDHSVETYPAYIVHNGTANAFISAMYASDVLGGIKNMLSLVQAFGIVLGLALVAVFAFYGGLRQMGALSVVLFQSVWSLLVLVLSKYKK